MKFDFTCPILQFLSLTFGGSPEDYECVGRGSERGYVRVGHSICYGYVRKGFRFGLIKVSVGGLGGPHCNSTNYTTNLYFRKNDNNSKQ